MSGKSDLTTRPNTAMKNLIRPKTTLIGYYLTHNKFFKKKNNTISNVFPRNENFTLNKNSKIENKKISEFNENLNNSKDDLLKIDSDKNTNIFKEMFISKNNDKIIKTGGFNILPAHSGALKNLVDQTNKLFLYKQKITLNPESKNIFSKFQKNIDNKFKYLQGVKSDIKPKQYEMGQNIVTNINTMIKNLEKKKD